MNTVDLSSLTRLPMKTPHSKFSHRTCVCCNMRKVTRESFTHDMEFENDYRYCDDCYPTILSKRFNKYQKTARNVKKTIDAEQSILAHRRRIVRTDNALGNDVGVSQYFYVSGCFVKEKVYDFGFVIKSFSPLKRKYVTDALMSADLLDFSISSMGYMEYEKVNNDLPELVLKHHVKDYSYPICELILKIKTNVKKVVSK